MANGKRRTKFEVKDIYSRGIKSDASKQLREWFMKPFALSLEGDIDWDVVLTYFFNLLTRDIFWCRIEEAIQMPGKYYVAPNKLVDGAGPRMVNKGEVVTVRTDETLPYVDIERVIDREEYMFRLTRAEWKWIKTKMKRLT